MKEKINLLLSCLIILIIYNSCQRKQYDVISLYPGEEFPGFEPALFAPGIISTGMSERDITFTPDGKELFYGLYFGRFVTIMHTQYKDGAWSEPAVASFASDHRFYYLEPCLSADGNRICFLSTRPRAGEDTLAGWGNENIWISDRQPDGSWGEAYDPGPAVNTADGEFYPSVAKSGALYFTRSMADGTNLIMRAGFENGKYLPAMPLPDSVNKNRNLFNAYISPAEDFLIGCAVNKNDTVNPGFANYYIFFRNDSGLWSSGINMGPVMNAKGFNAISASLSPDGKYLFFASQRTRISFPANPEKVLQQSDLMKVYNAPQNGNFDIYWMEAAFIQNMKPTQMNP
ncbi:MAG: hypothetical protein U0T82_15075 [Bacteroidales bacterium]